MQHFARLDGLTSLFLVEDYVNLEQPIAYGVESLEMKSLIGDYLLRDWQRTDAPAITQYANNPKIAANLRDGFPHPYGPSDAEAFLARAMAMQPPTFFAIASETEAIGSIGLMLGQDVHRLTAEMGYWLAKPFWDGGYDPGCHGFGRVCF
jgi:RimJ/RimL family protein N-acetyltransferase